MSERHAARFRNGRIQAVRIPREFELELARRSSGPVRQSAATTC